MSGIADLLKGVMGRGHTSTGSEDDNDLTDDELRTAAQTEQGGLGGIMASISRIFQPFIDLFNNAMRGIFNSNGLHAEQGMDARIDAAAPTFDQIVSRLGLPASMPANAAGAGMSTSEYLRHVCKTAMKHFINGEDMATDPAAAVREMLHVQDELAGVIGSQLRSQYQAAHPQATPAEVTAALTRLNVQTVAAQAASSITGIDLAVVNQQGASDDDKIAGLERCNTGMLGMMLATQRPLTGQDAHLNAADVPAMAANTSLNDALATLNAPPPQPNPHAGDVPPPPPTPPAPPRRPPQPRPTFH